GGSVGIRVGGRPLERGDPAVGRLYAGAGPHGQRLGVRRARGRVGHAPVRDHLPRRPRRRKTPGKRGRQATERVKVVDD
ncbi:unnamed protein product, partial [Ectocarpus sp. 12 AP-2014]